MKSLDEVRGYPLAWPEGQKRTASVRRKPNTRGWIERYHEVIIDLEEELRRSQIRDWIISSNVRPHSTAHASLDDPGAALWFMQRQGTEWRLSVLACDVYQKFPINVRAISLTLQRLRLINEYGCYSQSQAMAGAAYQALPPPAPPPRDWWTVMNVAREAPFALCKAAYRALAKELHSDQGGTGDMAALNEAWEVCKREKGDG